jgi:AcrR family transcriptional regulator
LIVVFSEYDRGERRLSSSVNSAFMEKGPKRKYDMRKRAGQVAETRARIVRATVDLHREVGPARTTVAEVARRAGVERLTVYNHFPDDAALFGACQAHWLAETPPPDLAAHAAVADPGRRLEAVLAALFGWYRQGEQMLRHVTRDAETLPALRDSLEARDRFREQAVALLLRGRGVRGAARRRVGAALAVALDFRTWDILAGQGLTDAEAVRVAAAMVDGAAR